MQTIEQSGPRLLMPNGFPKGKLWHCEISFHGNDVMDVNGSAFENEVGRSGRNFFGPVCSCTKPMGTLRLIHAESDGGQALMPPLFLMDNHFLRCFSSSGSISFLIARCDESASWRSPIKFGELDLLFLNIAAKNLQLNERSIMEGVFCHRCPLIAIAT